MGETVDVSHLAEFNWLKWVKFRHASASFPNVKVNLGCYLGPSLDVGSMMTAKILNKSRNAKRASTYRPLTHEKLKNEDEKNEQL